MELTNEFDVAAPLEVTWNALTDLERIAPCLPGAQLREIEGDDYRGVVKVKVGPITASYDGTIRVIERDESEHRVTLRAEGRETRGQGNVAAVFEAVMSPSAVGTRVVVTTDLSITGKVAQFGRGVLADVSAKLLEVFVANLESSVLAPADLEASGAEEPASEPDDVATSAGGDADAQTQSPTGDEQPGALRHVDAEASEPLDLFEYAGVSLARRLVKPVLTAALIAFALGVLRRKRR